MVRNRLFTCLFITTAFLLVSGTTVSAEEKTVVLKSSSATKVTKNNLQNVGLNVIPNNAWLNYNFTGEFLWNNATEYPRLTVDTWEIESQPYVNFNPNTGATPPTTSNQFSFLNDEYASIINYSGGVWKPNEVRHFFRSKLTLPDDARQIKSAKLYVSSDNLAYGWINGQPIGPDLSTSYVNYRCQGPFQDGWLTAHVKGGVRYFDVTRMFTLTQKNYLLAFNLMNANPCNEDHPNGIQYFLLLTYDTEPSGENLPPVCTDEPALIVPQKQVYAPYEYINFVPTAYDPEGADITITNWFKSDLGGVFTDLNNMNYVEYRSPPTGGVTDTISYIASDGVNTSTCSFNISTKIAFECGFGQQCYVNSQGNFDGYQECMQGCDADFGSKFTCNDSYQCVPDENGEFTNETLCLDECSPPPGDVACLNINTTEDSADRLLLSALVNNFSTENNSYRWVSSYSQANLSVPSDNYECSPGNPADCSMTLTNRSYTVPEVYYQKPPIGQTDTIRMVVDSVPNESCEIYICPDGTVCDNPNSNANLDMSFDRSTYTLNEGESLGGSLNFIVNNYNYDQDYNVTISCDNTDLICTFTENSSDYIALSPERLETLSNGVGLGVTIQAPSGIGAVSTTINANGYLSPGNTELRDTASAQVEVNSVNNIYYQYKIVPPTVDPNVGKEYYCENNTVGGLSDLPSGNLSNINVSLTKFDFSDNSVQNIFTGTPQQLDAQGLTPTNGTYSFRVNDQTLQEDPINPLEVYCVHSVTNPDNVTNYGSKSAGIDFTNSNNEATVTAVIGPKLSEGWFKAIGGGIHSVGGFESDVPSGNRLLEGLTNLKAGVATVIANLNPFGLLDLSRQPENKAAPYGNGNKILLMDEFKNRFETAYASGDINITDITSSGIASMDNNSNETKFYVYNGDLTITQDFNLSNENVNAVPVLYVRAVTGSQGKVIIDEDVSELDMVLIADGNVEINTRIDACPPPDNEIRTETADYTFHIYRGLRCPNSPPRDNNPFRDCGAFWRPDRSLDTGTASWGRTLWKSTIPVQGNVDEGGDRLYDDPLNYFEFDRPSNDASYAVVQPIWIQSGEVPQINEYIRFTANLGSGDQSVDCPDVDGSIDPTSAPDFPDNIHRQYECTDGSGNPLTISGEITDPSLDKLRIYPSFPENFVDEPCISQSGSIQECNGSSVASVRVTWYKYNPGGPIPSGSCSATENIKITGGVIHKGTPDGGIMISSSRLGEVYNDPTETFIFRPEVYFSAVDSAFKEKRIFLQTLD